LQQEALSGSNATRELQKFAAWLNKDGRAFEVINPGYSKCTDTEKNEAIRPLVKELGFNDEVKRPFLLTPTLIIYRGCFSTYSESQEAATSP
jgi:hypothetical protein